MAMRGMSALLEDVGDARGHGLLNLKLEDKVNALGDKLLGVLDGDVRIVAVVEDEQFHAGGGGGGRDALCDGDGKGHFRALDGEAEAQAARTRDQPVLAVLRLGNDSRDEPES